MPRRNDIAKVLIIGSGPIVIGQSAEFDYSGAQACKALKSEGYEVVLANSNPATIMTDPEMADRTYIEPLTRTYLEEIIRVEAEMLAASGNARHLRAAADGRRADRAEPRGRAGRRRRAGEVRRAAHRRAARRHQESRRPPAVQRRDDGHRPRRAEVIAGQQSERRHRLQQQNRFPGHPAPVVHARRHRRRHRLQPRRAAGTAGARPRSLAGA